MKRSKPYAVLLTEKLQSIIGKSRQGSQVNQRISEGKEEILEDLYYGFAEAFIWAEYDLNSLAEDGSEAETFEDEGYTIHDISQESRDQIRSACIAFYTAIMSGGLLPDSDDVDWVQIGNNFYLAGQGHGSNFMDAVGTPNAPYNKETAIKLNDLAKKFGTINESWSEDGKVYVSIR